MAWLLPLQPLGLGTGEIEALPSYFYRLATSHGITTGKLISYYYQWNSLEKNNQNSGRIYDLRVIPPIKFIRPNSSTKAMAQLLSHATGQSYAALETMTFLALEYGLNRPSYTFADTFRWCQLCLMEAHQMGQAPYFKLSWQLCGINACHIHKSSLRDRCVKCKANQSGAKFTSSISDCAGCGSPLWLTDELWLEEYLASLGFDYGSDVIELINYFASNEGVKFPAEGISEFIAEINNSDELTNREKDLRKKLPHEEQLILAERRKNISLEAARRIAFRLDVSLADLLLGNSKNTSRSFCFGGDFDLPDPIKVKERVRLKKKDCLLSDLRKLNLDKIIPPLSLRAVARTLGVSVGALQYHFPKEASKIVARSSEYIAIEREKVLLRMRTTVLDTIVNWENSSEKAISRKAVLKQLYAGSNGAKNVLRKEINAVFDVMGLGG